MAKIWRNRLIAGDQKFEDCPKWCKAKVIELLKADVDAGTISKKRYKEITGENY